MKVKNISKLICLILAVCMALSVLTACGAKAMTVTVKDMDTSTEIETTTGVTIAEALETAKITLAEKDETEPAKDTKLTEDVKEITVKRYAEVTVVSGDEKKQVALVGGTVEDAVKEAGFTITDEIKPDAPLTDYLKSGMTITLVKGVKVELTVDGKTAEITTFMTTVEAFLKEQNVTLGDDDTVSEKLDAKITDGMKITVSRVTYKEETSTEKVDYETEEKYSDSMDQGTSEVTQQGAEGEKTVTYKVKYVDGKEDSREKLSEEITKQPVTKIVTYGSRSTGGSGSGDSGSDPIPDDVESGVYEVSRQDMPDCDGSGHGYYIVTYSDGTVDYEEY